MSNYIETSVRYAKTCEDGKAKKVTDRYLVAADSFTEAEARVTAHVADSLGGEFTVSAVRKSNVAEIISPFHDPNRAGRYYKAKVCLATLDERSGAEKRTAIHCLIASEGGFRTALDELCEHFSGCASDWEPAAIAETPIAGVLDANATERNQPQPKTKS